MSCSSRCGRYNRIAKTNRPAPLTNIEQLVRVRSLPFILAVPTVFFEKEVMPMQTFTEGVVDKSIEVARRNWKSWHDVFEYGSDPGNPLLSDPQRFALFLREYSVRRTIRAGTHERFRQVLAVKSRELAEIKNGNAGQFIDVVEADLRADFGTCEGTRKVVSAVSKVAAFLRPDRYLAWDKYGKRGANIALNRGASSDFSTYAEYLAICDEIWDGSPGELIRQMSEERAESPIEKELRFQRRVLDFCLMILGGRSFR